MKRQSHTIILFSLFGQICKLLTLALLVTLIIEGWFALAVDAAEESRKVEVVPRSPSSESFLVREFDFRALPTPPVVNPPSVQSQSYLVYVGAGNSSGLQQVQQLEPAAFVRQYQGKAVIQAGVFSQNDNAQKLAKQLEYKGIDARIVNLATGQDTDFVSEFYFVVIPAKRDKLAAIEDRVKQLRMGMQVNIVQQQQPRTQVRVGPFLDREQAENWRRYLRSSGLRKTRVYYGRS